MDEETAKTHKLFFALWPPAPVRAGLAGVSRTCSKRPVPAPNLHMTLVFLGNCTEQQLDCCCRVAATVHAEPFELSLDYLGGWRRPAVQWLGSSNIPQPLQELVRALQEGLRECGFEPEKRRFVPHVTLARKVRNPQIRAGLEPLRWVVNDWVLVESAAVPGGVDYRVLDRWELRGTG